MVFTRTCLRLRDRFVRHILPLAICSAWLFLSTAALAEKPGQILFLQLKFTDDTATLVQAKTRPGKLKRSAQPPAGIKIQLATKTGLPLEDVLVPNPLVQRFEMEDPEKPGHWTVKEVRHAEREITVRIPFHAEGAKVTVFRQTASANTKGAPEATLLGSFDLHLSPEQP